MPKSTTRNPSTAQAATPALEHAVATTITDLTTKLEAAKARIAELESQPSQDGLIADLTAHLAQAQARIEELESSGDTEEELAQLRSRAQVQAFQLITSAQEDANRIIAEAKSEAEALREAAVVGAGIRVESSGNGAPTGPAGSLEEILERAIAEMRDVIASGAEPGPAAGGVIPRMSDRVFAALESVARLRYAEERGSEAILVGGDGRSEPENAMQRNGGAAAGVDGTGAPGSAKLPRLGDEAAHGAMDLIKSMRLGLPADE